MSDQDDRRVRELTVAMNGLTDRVRRLEAKVESLSSRRSAPADQPERGDTGDRQPIDLGNVTITGEHGDPIVKMNNSRWKGASCKDKHFSACPPDFLASYAQFLDWCADNPMAGKEQYSRFNAMDAQRARLWAKKIESEGGAPLRPAGSARPAAPQQTSFPTGDDEAPFDSAFDPADDVNF